MPEFVQAPFNTFIGGLITEAGPLTFPEGASIDELNCDLFKDGSRRRRLGMAIETSAEYTTETVDAGTKVSTSVWQNVAEQSGINFVVTQIGSDLIFFEIGGTPLSSQRVETTIGSGTDYTLDLSLYERTGSSGAGTASVEITSVKGAMVVASPEINTLLVERDDTTGAFTVSEIDFRIRDYDWQGDTTDYFEDAAYEDNREYDTRNAGWIDSALSTFGSNLPPLTHPWFSGKLPIGFGGTPTFNKGAFNAIDAGTSLITNGRYVLDLYTMNRSGASGVATVSSSPESARFSTVAAYSGRVFYSGMQGSTADNGSKIFFSQILEIGFSRIGECHQRNDPTSENFSDLLDNDGGYISIPEAHNIRKLHVFGPNLFVFAENGIWKIGGVDDVFRATDYSVSKISEDGITEPGSFVSAQGRPYWWSNSGIFTLGASQVGEISAQNLSSTTIQTFWDNIGATKRSLVRGVYDETQRRVLWMYPSATEANDNKRNEFLFFDEQLSAFFPWTIADQTTDTDYVVDAVFSTGEGASTVSLTVTDSLGVTVTDSALDDVTVSRTDRTLSSSRITFLVVRGSDGATTFAEATDTDFVDWGDADYSSFAEAGYSFLGDLEQRKTVPYVTSYLKRTESGWEAVGSGYELTRTSSCKLSCFWDFRNIPSGISQELYRLKYTPVVDTGDLGTVDYPTDVITSRLKVRGRGRSMRVKFESVSGKDFHLLGWNVLGARNGRF